MMSEVNLNLPDPTPKNISAPDLRMLFLNNLKALMNDFNCVMIGTIEAFDAGSQTASVSINFKRVVGTGLKDYPILVDCPVFVLTGGIGTITMPIAKGDTCVVLFNDRDIDLWYGTGQVLPPNSTRSHSLSDGIALVGIRSALNPIEAYNTNGIEANHGVAQLTLENENEAHLFHGESQLTLIDGEKAELKTEDSIVSAEDLVLIQAGGVTLKQAMTALFTALTSWVDTNEDTPNAATIVLLNAAKTMMEQVLK